MLVDSNELGRIFGVNTQTIYKWVKEGCPGAKLDESKKGGTSSGYRFETKEVARWREKRVLASVTAKSGDTLTKEEAQRRKLSAEAAMAELELAQKTGEVADLKEIERKLSDQFAQLRSSMRKIPERCVLRLVGETDERRVKAIILEEIDGALEVLSDE